MFAYIKVCVASACDWEVVKVFRKMVLTRYYSTFYCKYGAESLRVHYNISLIPIFSNNLSIFCHIISFHFIFVSRYLLLYLCVIYFL